MVEAYQYEVRVAGRELVTHRLEHVVYLFKKFVPVDAEHRVVELVDDLVDAEVGDVVLFHLAQLEVGLLVDVYRVVLDLLLPFDALWLLFPFVIAVFHLCSLDCVIS